MDLIGRRVISEKNGASLLQSAVISFGESRSHAEAERLGNHNSGQLSQWSSVFSFYGHPPFIGARWRTGLRESLSDKGLCISWGRNVESHLLHSSPSGVRKETQGAETVRIDHPCPDPLRT